MKIAHAGLRRLYERGDARRLNPAHVRRIRRVLADLDVARNTLSRLLHGRIGVSPKMALAMERIGWGNADHWMRVQAAYDLALARRGLDAA